MPQAPEQLVPLIKTSFECMATIQLEQNGQLPPPAKVTWRWKEEAMARISMAKVCGCLRIGRRGGSSVHGHHLRGGGLSHPPLARRGRGGQGTINWRRGSSVHGHHPAVALK
jgi:hypothetical protein